MKNSKTSLYALYATVLLFTPSVSFADNWMTFTPYVAPSVAAKYYTQYEHREPCQYYKSVPQSLINYDRCGTANQDAVIVDKEVRLLPVVATYTIYFDFDKSDIKQNQYNVIQKIANEINSYNPSQVTVVGYTDTSGDATYNKELSAKRADTVSRALTVKNISNFYLNEHAMGEENLAVPTPDGTRLNENRRVVIQFRK